MRPRLHADLAGLVAIDQAAAIEIETKAVLSAARMVGGQVAIYIMRESQPLHFRPVHRQLFGIAKRPLLKVKRPQYPRHIRRLGLRGWAPRTQREKRGCGNSVGTPIDYRTLVRLNCNQLPVGFAQALIEALSAFIEISNAWQAAAAVS